MKIRLTLWLTLSLFVMMLAAGGISSYLGYFMGREALKVVTQPDANAEDPFARRQPPGGKHKGLKIVNEKEILTEVYNLINAKENKPTSKERSQLPNAELVDYESNSKVNSDLFPIIDRSNGVTLEITKAIVKDDSLLLKLKLSNEGSDSVRFLYSFLDIKNDRGQPLSAIAEGLPDELPANGKVFRGSLRIPTALLDNAQNISLKLTDYPEKVVELYLAKIPIAP